MKMIDAINLAMDDHRAAKKSMEDYEYLDALRNVRELLELLKCVANEGKEGE